MDTIDAYAQIDRGGRFVKMWYVLNCTATGSGTFDPTFDPGLSSGYFVWIPGVYNTTFSTGMGNSIPTFSEPFYAVWNNVSQGASTSVRVIAWDGDDKDKFTTMYSQTWAMARVYMRYHCVEGER